jgi:hypothetical protein
MVEEMESLYNNDMWDLVKLPNGKNPFSRKWVFKNKMNTIVQFNIFKDHLVA